MDFRDLYEEHVTFVWRTLRRFGVRDSDIKDAMQDVQIVVFRKLPEFVPRGEIRNWLFRICFRIAKDYRRRAHVRREVLDEEPLLDVLDPRDDAEVELQRMEKVQLFEQALSRLEEGQRTVFVLAVVERMTGDEIARALRLPLGTVYSRLRLAREAFHRALTMLTARAEGPGGGIA
jgi:RNA polymerase sigma-70 factor (ECF subfamily)